LISRADFVFTIGYEGNTAVVDGTLKRRYSSLSSEQLAEKGMYKQALCSAVYELAGQAGKGRERGEEALQRVLEIYNRSAARKVGSVEELKRIFGVFEVPEGVGKVTVV
jgi:hypothetical protein